MDSRKLSAGIFVAVVFAWALASNNLHAQSPAADTAQSAAEAAKQVATDAATTVKKALNEMDNEDSDEESVVTQRDGTRVHLHPHSRIDDFVPFAVFAFIMCIVLGTRAMRTQTESKKIELLKLMVEKGQPIPESFLKDQISDLSDRGRRRMFSPEKSLSSGIAMSIAGVSLLAYGLTTPGSHSTLLMMGLIFASLGLGSLLSRRFANDSKSPNTPS